MVVSRPLRKFRSVNSDATSFPTLVCEKNLTYGDAGTAAGRCILPLAAGGIQGACRIKLLPYGLGADNDTFNMRVVAWSKVVPNAVTGVSLYVPTLLAVIGCTISTSVGLAGMDVLDTERFADTLAVTFEGLTNSDVTDNGIVQFWSPANDTPGHVIIDLPACEALELFFDSTLNTPTMNALYSLISDQ